MPFSEGALRQSTWVEIGVGWPGRADLVIVVAYDSGWVRAGYDESPGDLLEVGVHTELGLEQVFLARWVLRAHLSDRSERERERSAAWSEYSDVKRAGVTETALYKSIREPDHKLILKIARQAQEILDNAANPMDSETKDKIRELLLPGRK